MGRIFRTARRKNLEYPRTQAPLRKIVGVEQIKTFQWSNFLHPFELLECGHLGKSLLKSGMFANNPNRRRCMKCLEAKGKPA